ncbi:MAG: hypothetical protein EPO35_05775 [Acidobacteria bacterium]|nr:MAG: hypothetical protein EPO35_05775 [Acidobacteriota bacterium]
MLVKAVGVVMLLDGVLSAMSAAGKLDTFVYRSLRDQALVVAHFLLGAALVLSGRHLLTEKRHRVSFPENDTRCRFAASTVVAALAINGLETTRFDWPQFAARVIVSAIALFVLWRRRKTTPGVVS